MARLVYGQASPWLDLTVTQDNEILQHKHIALLAFTHKHIRDRDLRDAQPSLEAVLKLGLWNAFTVRLTLHYVVFKCGKTENIEQQLIQKGRQEGVQAGIQKGLQKAALNLLSLGTSRDLALKATGLTEENLAQAEKEAMICRCLPC